MPNSVLNFPDFSQLELEDAKQLLRTNVRESRKALNPAAQANYVEAWKETVLEFIGDAKTIAGFASTHFEPPTFQMCQEIADMGKNILLPKLGPGLTRAWGYFRGIDDLKQMAPGRPPEPSGPAFDNDILQEVDVIITPALLMSKYGERLGQGGGWYDRALKNVDAKTPVGAMVFPDEYVDFHLPQDKFDVKIPYVLTPHVIYKTEI